ncbi:MAG: signal recognition particle-docking protein FtsY [Deltaproteobacteria bacterium]
MEENKKKKKGFFKRIFKRDEERVQEDRPALEPEEDDLEAVEPSVVESREVDQPEPAAVSAGEPSREESLYRLQTGLTKTRSGFVRSLDELFLGKKELDEEMVARLEEILVTADIGVQTAYQLLDSVTSRVKRKELDSAGLILVHLKAEIEELLLKVESPLRVGFRPEPFVVMVVGVNGSGKTTTIAKIAARHKAAGTKVLMVAADTFRAAAVEQMEIWADRVGCPVVKGKEKADPSSVAFLGMERALAEGSDLVLIDTAGRLHTRVPLMEQLKKLSRTLDKKLPGAPHETLLVIDASNGQNAILQAKTFHEAVPVTGIALTKLDGTAKGGVLVGISNELNIPVRYIGIGEKMDDLRDFNARDFAEALFADTVLAAEH